MYGQQNIKFNELVIYLLLRECIYLPVAVCTQNYHCCHSLGAKALRNKDVHKRERQAQYMHCIRTATFSIPQTNTHLNPISLVIWSIYFRFILKQ